MLKREEIVGSFNGINNKKSLILMMVRKNLLNGRLVEMAIEEGMDFMMPISRMNTEPFAVEIFNVGEIESTRVVIEHMKEKGLFTGGDTLMHWVAKQRLPTVFFDALDLSEQCDIKNDQDETPLSVATRKANLEVIKFLLDRGANVNTINHTGDSPLHVACTLQADNRADIVDVLLRFNPELNQGNNQGLTPLTILCKNITYMEETDSMDLLMMAGADPTIPDKNDRCALEYIQPIRILNYYSVRKSCYDEVVGIMFRHIVLKKSENKIFQYIGMKDFFFNHCDIQKWKSIGREMMKGLEIMKSVTLGNHAITLWDIAVAPVEKISVLFKNRGIMTAALNCKVESCSILDKMLKRKLEQAQKRRVFADRCIPYLREVLDAPLPHLCMETIVDYLDERTLQVILECHSQKSGIRSRTCEMFDS